MEQAAKIVSPGDSRDGNPSQVSITSFAFNALRTIPAGRKRSRPDAHSPSANVPLRPGPRQMTAFIASR